MTDHDVIIVGNGALGLAVAYALASLDSTLRLLVIGPADRRFGASGAAGAMLGCFGEVTASLMRSPQGRAKHALGLAATKLWPSWLESINAELSAEQRVVTNPGTFVINNTRSGVLDDENFSAIQAELTACQEAWEFVEPSRISGFHPAEDSRALRALYIPNEASLDARRYLSALAAAIRRWPTVQFLDENVTELRLEQSTVRGVVTSTGRVLAAPHVVLALGVGTHALIDPIAELRDRVPPLFSGAGCSVVVEVDFTPGTSTIRTPNGSFACGLHAVPQGGSRIYVGATAHVVRSPISQPSVRDTHALLEMAMDSIHQQFASARLCAFYTGNRPVPVDTYPLIGPCSVAGLWFLTGTYRDGLHMSPLLGQDLARRILGKSGLYENPFLPERLPISTLTRSEAISEGVDNYTSASWEEGVRLSRSGRQPSFIRMFRDTIASIYDAIDSEITLPPDLLPMVEEERETMIPYFHDYYARVLSRRSA